MAVLQGVCEVVHAFPPSPDHSPRRAAPPPLLHLRSRAQHGPQFSMTCVKDVVDTFARVAWKAQVQDLGQQQFAIVKPNP